jgi:uncharacterized protein (DUF1499 family)
MARHIGSGIVILLLAAVAAGIGLRHFMERAAENRLWPGEDVALAGLPGPLPANAFLACPPHYCQIHDAAASPVLAIDADALYWDFLRLVERQPRIVILADRPQQRRIALIERSAVFRFPDIVIAEFVALGAKQSSIALYSRARYGRSDFGVNRRRVVGWLADLDAAAARR